MKVRVTRTVEFDEVPEIIERIVDECRSDLDSLSEFKFSIFDLESAGKNIEDIKVSLDLISDKLDDCLNLAKGYVANLNKPAEQKENPADIELEEGNNA